jgi:hypothetical protein
MGACTFITVGKGKTAESAFRKAVKEAKYLNGHGGYTGTIAEKDSFKIIGLPPGVNAGDHARNLLENEDPRINDKWGPAGCIALGRGEFLFFGWASE